jgi:deoxyribodipyrimidine photo-lyase
VATTIVWFRQDLRLADQPAVAAAARRGRVVPLLIWSPEEEGDWPPGGAARWWLHHALTALDGELRSLGSRLVLRSGPALAALLAVARETGADAVYWCRRYEPAAIRRDTAVKAALRAAGLAAESFNGSLLREPWEVTPPGRPPITVFTRFHEGHAALGPPAAPLPAPVALAGPDHWPASDPLDSWGLLPRPDWAAGLRAEWQPGPAGASRRLAEFLDSSLAGYADRRDRPGLPATSRLSAHLHWGELSPRQVWHAVASRRADTGGRRAAAWSFHRELVWREFGHAILYHFPATPDQPLRSAWAGFPWRDAPDELEAWRRGRTGFPIIDAGMRELWATGWMHNRVRMLTASFLTKDLLIDWRSGARWFWDTLVDADLANNTYGWQWVAGCGTDQAAYPRIFNPVAQGEKFDPKGDYVRRWVPELAGLPHAFIHRPWTAPAAVLADAGVNLGVNYPRPIVDHAEARRRAVAAWQRLTVPKLGVGQEIRP